MGIETALIIAAVASVAGTAGAVVQGQEQKAQQRQSLRDQRAAQAQAELRARSELRRSETESRRLNRRQPNVGNILARERQASQGSATLLTGPRGVNSGIRSLGRGAVLGGS